MVAKQTKKRPATPRKQKADPIERARIEAAKGLGEADPALVAMVAEWMDIDARFKAREVPATEGDETFERLSALHHAIYAFPAATLADLCAKLPPLRDELTNLHIDRAENAVSLEQMAWWHVIADLERLAGPAASHASTPQAAASIEFEPVAGIEPPTRAEWDRLSQAHFDRVAVAFALLGKTKPQLMQMWEPEEVGIYAASAIERARDWLADTTATVDEALARFLVAGAAYAEGRAA